MRGGALLCAAASVLFTLGCGSASVTGGDAPPPVTVKAGLNVVSGAGQTDSVLALLPEQLIVQLGDANGRPIAAKEVQFTVVRPAGTELKMHLCRISDLMACDDSSAREIQYVTDAIGQARCRAKLGRMAGVARVAIGVPELGWTDTISFTAVAGTPVRLGFNARDSALYVGNSYAIGGALRDAYGNIAPGPPVTYTVFGSVATVDGGAFRGVSVGRGGAVAQSGQFADTAWVTVTPRGSIAGYDLGGGGVVAGIAKIEMDGSGYRFLVPTSDTYYGSFPNWTTNAEIVFEAGVYNRERAFVTDTLGNVRRLTPDGTPTFAEVFNAPAKDGSVFVSAWGSPLDYGTGIWRVAAPGAPPERMGPNPAGNANAWKASPSATSDELAYSDVNRGGLSIMRVSDGSMRVVLGQADMPRWSPQGDWIAFSADSTLYRIRPDGTGQVRVGPDKFYAPRADWSPDGRWLIARSRSGLELIDVETGATLALPFGKRLTRPAWR